MMNKKVMNRLGRLIICFSREEIQDYDIKEGQVLKVETEHGETYPNSKRFEGNKKK